MGDFIINNKTVASLQIGGKEVIRIANGQTVLWEKTSPQPVSDYLCFTANTANCTVGMRHYGTNQTTTQPVMYYSTDQTNWTLWDYSNITLANVGDKVYFYGNNPNGFSSSYKNYSQFTTSGSVACSGNIMTLITRDGSETTIPSIYCFTKLFSGTTITNASNLLLPATQLMDICYNALFKDCISLTSAPQTLPSTTLNYESYSSMFYGCTSLTTTPILPATTLAANCYQNMFRNCTSLTSAPELPATTLTTNCYKEMFNGCSQLNYIKVGATTWNSSYTTNWVNGVAATGTFVKPAELAIGTGSGQIPANSASGIPTGWTVQNTNDYLCFTAVAPNAKISLNPAPSDYSANLYYSTDGGTTFNTLEPHTNITLANIGDKMYVYGNNASLGQSVHFQISADTSISGNLTTLLNQDGLTTLPDYAFVGTFKNNTHIVDVSGLTIPVTSVGQFALQSLFSGCTNITTAPALPATTIGNGCYSYMFYGCTSLTSAPALPATTLATQCYYGMFQGCTSLITPPSLPATILATYCYSSMFANCTSLTTSPDLNALTLRHSSYAAMFYGCTNLNSIKCLATNISAQACTDGWVDGVSATGTFTKNPQMSNWTTGIDGIPSGWTVVDAQ